MGEPDSIPLVARALEHAARPAVIASEGRFLYADLLDASARLATSLLGQTSDLHGARVAIMLSPGFAYVAALLGVWRAGGIAVPLCITHPAPELAHVLDDSGALGIVTAPEREAVLWPLARARGVRLLRASDALAAVSGTLPRVDPSRPALLIYTSGTTGKPKGALTTHAIVTAQMRSIVQAWELCESDHILHVLPLHHLHGILNALLSVLYAGGVCELLPRFDAARVLARFAAPRDITLFMAVPTIYAKLVAEWEASSVAEQRAISDACHHLRLFVSGSAALPASMLERFAALSGHVLLERYGMTEIGMGLGNPLHGERRAGYVGVPFPGVQARLVDDARQVLGEEAAGKLEIRGPNLFREYWGKPEATSTVFTPDGWFKTGDVAIRERGYYRLLGRESVDILKTGGYKVSALEIEEALREHAAIAEVCVVGVPDETFGQRVAAAVITKPGASLTLDELRAFGKQRMAAYKVPTRLLVVTDLPRNAMGKVQKQEVMKLFAGTK